MIQKPDCKSIPGSTVSSESGRSNRHLHGVASAWSAWLRELAESRVYGENSPGILPAGLHLRWEAVVTCRWNVLTVRKALLAAAALASFAVSGSAAQGERGDWYPSAWGPEDERGAANRLTPEKVLEAVKLVEEG